MEFEEEEENEGSEEGHELVEHVNSSDEQCEEWSMQKAPKFCEIEGTKIKNTMQRPALAAAFVAGCAGLPQ